MTPQEIDRIECAIRHIESSLDVDPWAAEIAFEAMEKQIPKKLSKNSPKLDKENGDLQPTCNQLAKDTNVLSNDCISRQEVIDALTALEEPALTAQHLSAIYDCEDAIKALPPAQPDGWLEQNKDKILQAGMEGREIDFRIGGRLFAIREKAQ